MQASSSSIMIDENHLDHLDDFSLMDIFDLLKLEDLINIATINSRFEELVLHHYIIGKYHLNKRPIKMVINDAIVITDNLDRPFASGFKQSLWVLKQFGHIFSFIEVHCSSLGSYESRQLINHINMNRPDALQEITISALSNYSINDGWLEHSFHSIESVTLNDLSFSTSIRLNRIFPSVEKLVLNNVAELPFIDSHFPNLINFSILQIFNDSIRAALFKFIKLNPQLRYFGTTLPNDFYFYLQYVNEMLPNLEKLTIHNERSQTILNRNNTVVRFRNIRKFALYLSQIDSENVAIHQILPIIAFERLEIFEVSSALSNSNSVNELIEIIRQNRQLKKVAIKKCELTYRQISYLVQSLPLINELAIDWYDSASLHEIRRFLMDDSRLQKIAVPIYKHGWGSKHIFKLLPSDWKVSEIKNIGYKQILLLKHYDAHELHFDDVQNE